MSRRASCSVTGSYLKPWVCDMRVFKRYQFCTKLSISAVNGFLYLPKESTSHNEIQLQPYNTFPVHYKSHLLVNGVHPPQYVFK